MNHRSSTRKTEILQAMADMLRQPHPGRITTAALAASLSLSEAALYRHYASKAAIFEDLIGQMESQLMQDLAHINATEPDGRQQLRKHAQLLLLFAQRHPGQAKVLTGHALVVESPELQAEVNRVIGDIQALLAQSAGSAIAAGNLPDLYSADDYANLLMRWITGRWLHYVQVGEPAAPTLDSDTALAMLGL